MGKGIEHPGSCCVCFSSYWLFCFKSRSFIKAREIENEADRDHFQRSTQNRKNLIPDIDYRSERVDIYVFSKKDSMNFGGAGNGPIVVAKADGRILNFVAMLDDDGFDIETVEEGYLKEFAD